MTKEIVDIIVAFKNAQLQGRQSALATVVHVEGSSYRRPGARMLVEENGKITGAISGGCLEGDALRKALQAMAQGQNKLVTYNTLDEDDVKFGVQLGCNGIVYILFEPIDPANKNNPIALLEKCIEKRKNAVVVTLFSLKTYYGHQPGTCFFTNGEQRLHNMDDHTLTAKMQEDATIVLADKRSVLKEYCTHELSAFVELVQPPVSLLIVGAGNDVIPLVSMATVLGWQTTIIDGRPTHANKNRFPAAYQVIVGKPAEVKKELIIDERTAVVLMTHNYNYDLEMMALLLSKPCKYIGTLGPKKRLERMLSELRNRGMAITSEKREMIYGPTGLDIGAESAEEIALSIMAEIKAVFTGRRGNSLRERLDVIHSRSAAVLKESNSDAC